MQLCGGARAELEVQLRTGCLNEGYKTRALAQGDLHCALAEPEPITTTNTISARHAKLLKHVFLSPVLRELVRSPPVADFASPCVRAIRSSRAPREQEQMPTVVATDAS